MKTQKTDKKRISIKNYTLWINIYLINLKILAVWIIYVKLSEKNLVY